METTPTLGNIFEGVGCIALIYLAFSLRSLNKKIKVLMGYVFGPDASTGATIGTPPKVGPGPKGDYVWYSGNGPVNYSKYSLAGMMQAIYTMFGRNSQAIDIAREEAETGA